VIMFLREMGGAIARQMPAESHAGADPEAPDAAIPAAGKAAAERPSNGLIEPPLRLSQGLPRAIGKRPPLQLPRRG
jgi:hypothetical protein